jgi:hypothetical protein
MAGQLMADLDRVKKYLTHINTYSGNILEAKF